MKQTSLLITLLVPGTALFAQNEASKIINSKKDPDSATKSEVIQSFRNETFNTCDFITKAAQINKPKYKKGIPIIATATEFITAVNFIQTSYETGKTYKISMFQNYKI